MLDTLYGNELLKRKLSAALAEGTLAHAYIFEGARGSGKHLLAWELASALAGVPVQRLKSGSCPDVTEYRLPNDRKTISVEQIRALKEEVSLKPAELSVKVYLLSDADTMTVQAQNAFLKLLEEPPENVYFFLLCESAASLLATVRSRAPTLRMQRFSEEELSVYLRQDPKQDHLAEKDPAAFQRVLAQAEGTIGVALQRLSGEKDRKDAARRESVFGLLSALCRREVPAVLRAISTFPQKREELSEITELLLRAIRDLLAEKKGGCAELLFFSREQAADLAAGGSAQAFSAMADAVFECRSAVAANGNVTLTLTLLTQRLLHALHG